uniref:Uncharacterized protein n=1 Tax=Tanacetum cinerariifolium TaxID=118510 RepID=A0A6L2KI63_TANCI|nr:hypothetical protein [Tanacetum cinerariifolium]
MPPGSPPHQPPPPPPPTGPSGTSRSPGASGSSQTAALAEYKAWTMTDTRLRLSVSSTLEDLQMDDDMALDAQAYSSDDEDIGNAYIPTVNLRVDDSIIRHNVSKPLSLGGPPGQIKAAYYPDVGLEQMVPDQMWIDEECKYDIAAIIEIFSMYGYDYMKKIVLRRADLNDHIITERDFKYLYPSDFEDLYLLNLQSHLNHLPPKDKKILTIAVNLWTGHLVIRQRVEDFQLGIESYQTQLNLTKPRWDATGFDYKHDYTVIDSLRAVTFRDRYGVQMIMRFNEIHKFSDGTLHQIDEALDYRVNYAAGHRSTAAVHGGDRWSTPSVNAVDHRSTLADHGGDRWSTVAVNDGRQWRTTVDCRWTTVDHHRTTGQRWLVGWSTIGSGPVWIRSGPGSGRVWIGSGPGPPRGMPCVSHVCTRVSHMCPRGIHMDVDVDIKH